MAVAVESFSGSFAPRPNYPAFFQRYVQRHAKLLADRVRASDLRSSGQTREQAWHVLNYALKLDAAWPMARDLLLALAPQMEREGYRHEWLTYLEEGVACSRRLHDRAAETHLARWVGRIQRLLGDYDAAATWLAQSLAQAETAGERRAAALALNELGYVARLQQQHDAARGHVEAALTRLDEDDVERATSYSWLAAIAYDQLDWDEAARFYQMAYDLYRAAGDGQRAAWNLQNLGDTLRNAGRLDEAAQIIGASIQLMGELQDPLNQAIGRMNLGIVHLQQEQFGEALALFALAENSFRTVRDPLQLAKVYNNMAMAERELGQFAAAERDSRKAIRLWEKLGDQKWMVNSMDELGLALEGQGREDEAMAVYRTGLRVLDGLPPDPFRDMLCEMLLAHFPPDQADGITVAAHSE